MRFVDVQPDYTARTEVADILAALTELPDLKSTDTSWSALTGPCPRGEPRTEKQVTRSSSALRICLEPWHVRCLGRRQKRRVD